MARHFFISDLHLGHAKVIEYDNRPYNSVEEMDEDLIKRWNSVVKKDDIVWFLGDLALTTNKEYLQDKISRLNGHKRMVMGNHDKRKARFYLDAGFDEVHKRPIVVLDYFILSHEPMDYMGEASPFFYIYGHIHNAEEYKTFTEHSACVCACRHDYTPIQIPEFTKRLREVEEDLRNRRK